MTNDELLRRMNFAEQECLILARDKEEMLRSQSRLIALVESYLKTRKAPHLSIRADDDQYDDPELWEIADIESEIQKCRMAA